MNRTSIAHRLLAASLGGLGLVLTALPAMAESQYGSCLLYTSPSPRD